MGVDEEVARWFCNCPRIAMLPRSTPVDFCCYSFGMILLLAYHVLSVCRPLCVALRRRCFYVWGIPYICTYRSCNKKSVS